MVRSVVGDYHAPQDCHHGDSSDRPHPPRWLGPATELGNVVRWHRTLGLIVAAAPRAGRARQPAVLCGRPRCQSGSLRATTSATSPRVCAARPSGPSTYVTPVAPL